jgi:peptide/nickel transport system substrate-binding protein
MLQLGTICDRTACWLPGQLLTRQQRHTLQILVATLAAAAALACRPAPADPPPPTATQGIPRGGDLRVAVRTEPQSFNWYTRRDGSTYIVTALTQARLFQVNRATQQVEPWLAEGSTRSDDGLRYTIKLRPNVVFADGHPFTAEDVVFSLAAAYNERAGSVLADSMKIAGKPLQAAALDALTVVITFPVPFAPGLVLFDNLPILPKHKLQGPLDAGTFGSAWGLATPVGEIAGLGPFVLNEYLPGERAVFVRNPRYFRKDAAGAPLPYLDRVIVEIVPDQNAQMLQLDTGRIDMTGSELRPEDYAPLKRAADAGRVQLLDLGVAFDPDSFWINLRPGAFARDPRAGWIQRDELRQAISLAVDRQAFADTVYLGAGAPVFGPVTPASKKWHSPDLPATPHDPARAKTLLASIGLTDRNGDGVLDDPRNQPARFVLLTQKGQTALERGAAVIRDELKKIGLLIDVAPLEGNALVQRFLSGQPYDAVYFQFGMTNPDPALSLDFWLSSGTSRVWNLAQKTPATDWERQIDELMAKQITATDEGERKRLFDQVQRVFAEHLPVVHFVAPKIFVAASSRTTNLTPAITRPQFLWAAETIAVKP